MIKKPYLIFVTKFTCETCGEKSVMWIFRFLTWQMWINLELSTSVMWRHFRFLHMTDKSEIIHISQVEKSEISPPLSCVWCSEYFPLHFDLNQQCVQFVVFCLNLGCFVAIYAVLSRFARFCVGKNDKYEVWKKHHFWYRMSSLTKKMSTQLEPWTS